MLKLLTSKNLRLEFVIEVLCNGPCSLSAFMRAMRFRLSLAQVFVYWFYGQKLFIDALGVRDVRVSLSLYELLLTAISFCIAWISFGAKWRHLTDNLFCAWFPAGAGVGLKHCTRDNRSKSLIVLKNYVWTRAGILEELRVSETAVKVGSYAIGGLSWDDCRIDLLDWEFVVNLLAWLLKVRVFSAFQDCLLLQLGHKVNQQLFACHRNLGFRESVYYDRQPKWQS